MPNLHIVPASLTGVEADALVQAILESERRFGVLAYDVESTGRRLFLEGAALRTVQFGVPDEAWYFIAENPIHAHVIIEVLKRALHLTAHNASFDIQWLVVTYGVNHDALWEKTTDTFLLSHIFNTDRDHHDLKTLSASWNTNPVSADALEDLKALARRIKCTIKPTLETPIENNAWAQFDLNDPIFQRYACADVLDGSQLCLSLLPYLRGEEEVVRREHRIAKLMSRTTLLGTLIDQAHSEALRASLSPQIEEVARTLHGMGLSSPTNNTELGALLTERGSVLPRNTRSYTVDVNVLESLSDPMAALVLEYRSLTKNLNTYVMNTLTLSSGDGRVHPSIKTLGARTGRMSASDPNVQNVPKSGQYRGMYIPDHGESFVSCDFASVEPRCIAALSDDVNLIEEYRKPKGDPYKVLAAEVYDDEWANALAAGDNAAWKIMRNSMKPVLLGRAYKGSKATLSEQTGLPMDMVELAIETFDGLYPDVAASSAEWTRRIEQGNAEVVTPTGRRVPVSIPYTAGNRTIQAWARDVLVDSCFIIDDAGLWPIVRFPVHDELILSVPIEQVDDYQVWIQEAMSGMVLDVPILGESEVLGERWHK